MVNTMKRLKALALAALLVAGSVLQIGCGNSATLERVGNVAVQLAFGFESEVNALAAAGLLKGAKLDALKQNVSAAKTTAAALNTYLLGLKEVNANDKAQITQKVAELAAIISSVLTSQEAFGLSEDQSVVKVLRYATISLNQVALVIAALKTPGAASFSTVGGGGGVPVGKIKIQFTEPPPEVKAHLR